MCISILYIYKCKIIMMQILGRGRKMETVALERVRSLCSAEMLIFGCVRCLVVSDSLRPFGL